MHTGVSFRSNPGCAMQAKTSVVLLHVGDVSPADQVRGQVTEALLFQLRLPEQFIPHEQLPAVHRDLRLQLLDVDHPQPVWQRLLGLDPAASQLQQRLHRVLPIDDSLRGLCGREKPSRSTQHKKAWHTSVGHSGIQDRHVHRSVRGILFQALRPLLHQLLPQLPYLVLIDTHPNLKLVQGDGLVLGLHPLV